MTYPSDVGVVDLMIGFPMRDEEKVYDYLMRGIKDSETKESFTFPAEYMFKDVPERRGRRVPTPSTDTLAEMDKYNIDMGLFGAGDDAIERA